MSIFETILYPITWILNNTIFYIYKGLCWLLSLILPSQYSNIFDEFMLIFWDGIIKTMYLALFGTIFGLLIAIVLGVIRSFKIKKNDSKLVKILKTVSNWIIKTYVTIFRGTPMMLQALIIFNSLYLVFEWEVFDAALFTVTINTAAYLTEVIRASIENVDPGQMEAARSLGFSYWKAMFYIVFPQALKNSMASIGNEFVINIKDTSVLNVIGCAEMYYVLKMNAGSTGYYVETLIAGALIYLILTYFTTKLLNKIEKKLDVPVKDFTSSN